MSPTSQTWLTVPELRCDLPTALFQPGAEGAGGFELSRALPKLAETRSFDESTTLLQVLVAYLVPRFLYLYGVGLNKSP